MVVESVERGVDDQELQTRVEEGLSELGRAVLRYAVEGVDERLREQEDERKGWVIAGRGDTKEILTSFGMVRYRRSYFRHKQTGRHRYLTDERVGTRA